MIERRRINPVVLVISGLMVVIIMAIVYAAFTGQLNISGTAIGRDSTWDIHFENVSTVTTNGTAKVLSNHQPVINSNNRTQIQDYEVSLTSPGDSISFTFDAVNDGNYNAKISSISIGTPQCTSLDSTSATNMCNNLTYSLTYASGASVNQNDILYAKDKITLKVTLTFANITNPALLPSAGVSIGNLGIEIDFEQTGNALVNETTGEVANNRVYHQGDKITLNNEDYWVIADSRVDQDYVVALKDEPLTANEITGAGGTSSTTGDSVGKMSYHSSSSEYTTSDVKSVIDNWVDDKFKNSELKEVDGYSVRLITKPELLPIGWPSCRFNCTKESLTPNWIWNSNYNYWTMTKYNSSTMWYVTNNGGVFTEGITLSQAVRPVINIYKSALETNNNNNNE